MIFTLFGYLLLVGIVKRDLRSSIVSLAVFVMVRRDRATRAAWSGAWRARAETFDIQRAARLTSVHCLSTCVSCALIPVRRSAVGTAARAGSIGQSKRQAGLGALYRLLWRCGVTPSVSLTDFCAHLTLFSRFLQLSWEGHLMGMTIGCVLGAYDGRAGPMGEEPAASPSKSVKAGEVTEKVRFSHVHARM